MGPNSVDGYDCGGSYFELWRLDPDKIEGVSLTQEDTPTLAISDTATLINFKLVVKGSYTFEGDTNSTIIELSYTIESLFNKEFLRLSVVETQPL